MRTLNEFLSCVVLVSTILIGCGSSEEEQPAPALGMGAKGEIFKALAQPLALDKKVDGRLALKGRAGDVWVYAIELKKGDEVDFVMTTLRNRLRPKILLYSGNGEGRPIWAKTFKLTNNDKLVAVKSLTKGYEIKQTGRYLVLVNAYQGRGSGGYSLLATCKGGPCAGEPYEPPPVEPTEFESGSDVVECLKFARTCSLADARTQAAAGTVVDAAKAKAIFDNCLVAGQTTIGYTCEKACSYVEEDAYNPDAAKDLCESIVGSVQFFAEKSPACMAEFDECMDTCMGDSYGGGPSESNLMVCLLVGFNGTCDYYAAEHESCGGTGYKDDSWMECCELISSTDGAWTDDMDVWCEEGCGTYCDDEVQSCKTKCTGSADDECVADCLELHAWGCEAP